MASTSNGTTNADQSERQKYLNNQLAAYVTNGFWHWTLSEDQYKRIEEYLKAGADVNTQVVTEKDFALINGKIKQYGSYIPYTCPTVFHYVTVNFQKFFTTNRGIGLAHAYRVSALLLSSGANIDATDQEGHRVTDFLIPLGGYRFCNQQSETLLGISLALVDRFCRSNPPRSVPTQAVQLVTDQNRALTNQNLALQEQVEQLPSRLAELSANLHGRTPDSLWEALVVARSEATAERDETTRLRAQLSELLASLASARSSNENYASTSMRILENEFRSALPQLTLAHLASFTNDFDESRIIGRGGYGPVYRAEWHGTPVAVKVLDQESVQGTEQFERELRVLSSIQHPYIAGLLGYSTERYCLVYELLAGGSLEDVLSSSERRASFPWHARCQLAADVASALLFLHSAQPDAIIHRDLKPANVLLDQHMRAKLCDVGLAALMPASAPGSGAAQNRTHATTRIMGTPAYLDPYYLQTNWVTPAADVYAFGLVLLQVLTGRAQLTSERLRLVDEVEAALNPASQNFASLLDSAAGDWNVEDARTVASLALACAHLDHRQRPDLRTKILPTLRAVAERAAEAARTAAARQPAEANPLTSIVLGMFECPIQRAVMEDPVIAADGYTYERSAIEAWLARRPTSPMTNLPMPTPWTLVPNRNLRAQILEWRQRQTGTANQA